MNRTKILYVVHCVDTEGPLKETLSATFQRLHSIFGIDLAPSLENLKLLQEKKIDLNGKENAVANCFSPQLLRYNSSWDHIDRMLDIILTQRFRREIVDDFDSGWVYSWHCMDHVGYIDNPRYKDVGYGNIFRYYKNKIKEFEPNNDEINWHFHPLSISGNPMNAATSYLNSYGILIPILCRRILEDKWFPVVNRPGFHSERPDSHAFLEQWIPFDFANQAYDGQIDQPDLAIGRFGDWTRAPKSWRGYHPSHDDYQIEGNCNRLIFRCLNVGTRLRQLNACHVRESFLEARNTGSAVLAFANHDYRDMTADVNYVRKLLIEVKRDFPDVLIKFSNASNAAKSVIGQQNAKKPKLQTNLIGNRLFVEVIEGEVFGPQPFLAIKTKLNTFHHDNFDVILPKKKWSYVFDDQTLMLNAIHSIGVGTSGKYGDYFVDTLCF